MNIIRHYECPECGGILIPTGDTVHNKNLLRCGGKYSIHKGAWVEISPGELKEYNQYMEDYWAAQEKAKAEESENNENEFKPSSYDETKLINQSNSLRLFEDDTHIIFSEYDTFILALRDWIVERPGISDDEKLLQLIEGKAKNSQSEISIVEVGRTHRLFWRLQYRIAELLEDGKCRVFNKSTTKFVKKLEVNSHGHQIGPLAGAGGRRFLADGEIFFEVEDWIS